MAAAPVKGFKVLIAIDSSQYSKIGMNFYMDTLHKNDNTIILMHVVELPDVIHSRAAVPAKLVSEKWNEEYIKGQQLLEKSKEILKNKGAKYIISRLDNAVKPGPVVVSVAKEEGINLVVVGSRGAGLIRRTVMGSVSDYILNHVHCPIVICKAVQEQKRKS